MRTCSRCGVASAAPTLSCQECGQPFPSRNWDFPRLTSLALLSYPLMCLFGLGAVLALLVIALGIVRLVRARPTDDRRDALGGVLIAGVGLALVVMLTLPAQIASRVRYNESAVITDIRGIMMAEVEYSKANGDQYDTLTCLAAPARCIPGYDATTAFLPPGIAANDVKSGYRRTFHAGPAPKGGRPKGTSPSSIAMWAYVAVPVSLGWSGNRSFCGDGSGRLCATTDGSVPAVSNGSCATSCPDLR